MTEVEEYYKRKNDHYKTVRVLGIMLAGILILIAAIIRSVPAHALTAGGGYDEYRVQGCAKFGEIVGDTKPVDKIECKKMAESTKGDPGGCVIDILLMRSAWLNEDSKRRPPGVALDAQVACSMIIYGVDENTARNVVDRTCNDVTSYEAQAWCRKERGR
jgi:hypothetical protein